jgi:hypothetical protein
MDITRSKLCNKTVVITGKAEEAGLRPRLLQPRIKIRELERNSLMGKSRPVYNGTGGGACST